LAFDRRPGPAPESAHRINTQIRVREVRLIDAEGEMKGVVAIEEALRLAQEAELDLVEIAPTAVPPVCKILDYGKFKYQEQKKKAPQKQKPLKELRLRPGTEEHDFETKLNHARRFLKDGSKVLVNMMFRGRQMAHQEIGRAQMAKFAAAIEDVAKVEQMPRMEGYRLQMTLVPKG
jgi:translation initiation factor IF-3